MCSNKTSVAGTGIMSIMAVATILIFIIMVARSREKVSPPSTTVLSVASGSIPPANGSLRLCEAIIRQRAPSSMFSDIRTATFTSLALNLRRTEIFV